MTQPELLIEPTTRPTPFPPSLWTLPPCGVAMWISLHHDNPSPGNKRALWLAVGLFLTLPVTATAGGPIHGAKAAGMGSAFVAVADDPSAVLHNPAGLTKVHGDQCYGGMTGVRVDSRFRGTGGSERTDFQIFPVPHLFASSELATESVVFGLGVYSLFGIGGRKWSETGLTRYQSTEATTATMSVNPSVAWRITPRFSVAFGGDYLQARKEAEMMLDQSPFGAADAKMHVDAEGNGWGINLGILYAVTDQLSVGLAWRSGIKVEADGEARIENIAPAMQPLFGGATYTSTVRTNDDFPEIYSFGVAWHQKPGWTVDLDIELVRWSSFSQSSLDIDQEVPPAGIVDSVTPLDWKDSWQVKVGLDYPVNDTLSLRTGYAYIPSPVPDHTLSPANPDADQHNFSIGLGYRHERIVVDVFYNLGLLEDRTANNTILAGEYSNTIHYGGMSIGYMF